MGSKIIIINLETPNIVLLFANEHLLHTSFSWSLAQATTGDWPYFRRCDCHSYSLQGTLIFILLWQAHADQRQLLYSFHFQTMVRYWEKSEQEREAEAMEDCRLVAPLHIMFSYLFSSWRPLHHGEAHGSPDPPTSVQCTKHQSR